MPHLYRVDWTRVFKTGAGSTARRQESISGTAFVSATTEQNAIAAAKTADVKGSDGNWEYAAHAYVVHPNILTGS